MLEPGIALLARLLLLAMLIEAGNSTPRSICTGLTSLGVEPSSKGIVLSEYRTIALQIVLGDATSIHPQAQALIADELGDAYRLIDSRIRVLGAS